VKPELLTLEITENAVLTDPTRAYNVLTRLAGIGVRISIDDFGVGHSSLAYLKRLPVHVLKIDKSFVLGMASDDDDAAIVRSTIDLAHNLGLQAVAEGVETEQLWRQLVHLGCDTVQGFYFARPLPAEDVLDAIDTLAPHALAEGNVVDIPRSTRAGLPRRQYARESVEETAV
jgi:EAL domain-containing protein (putative c-di-GMP-specific phosphodiesterase class I)